MDASYLCAIFTEHYASLSQSHCINPIKWPPLIAWTSTTTRLMASPPMRKILSSCRRRRLEVTGKWRYLGDMLLSHGQTYIGDLVAMGAAGIGPGRALAHRVNPVDGDQWVLVVDWVRA